MHRLVERAPASVPTPPANRKWFFLDSSTGLPSFKDSSGNVIAMLLSDAELTAIAALVSAANKIPMFSGSGVATLLDFDTDNTLAADSDTRIASQKAIKAFVAAQITALINAAPGVLDTLGELSDALADDPNFAATMTTALAGKAALVHTHPVADLSDASANGRSLISAADYAAMRTLLNVSHYQIPFIISGTGRQADLEIDIPGTIVEISMLGDASGSITCDFWKCTYANYDNAAHPVVGDSICGGSPFSISSAHKGKDSTLTGWTKTLAAGDVLSPNVSAFSGFNRVTGKIKVQRS